MALEAAQKSRKAKAGWLSRMVKQSGKMQARLQDEAAVEVTVTEFETLVRDFEVKLEAWEESQGAVEVLCEDDNLMDEINTAGDFRETCVSEKVNLIAAWMKTKKSAGNSDAGTIRANVKLPKLEITKYSGGVQEYFQFWDVFKANVDDTDIPEVSKFSYLLSLTEGAAYSAIKDLPPTGEHYEIAKNVIKNRWGRPEQAIFTHIQALLEIKTPPQGCELETLQMFYDTLYSHVRCLEKLKVDGEKYGIVLTPLVVSKLPQDIRMEWARGSLGKEGDFHYVEKFLKDELSRRERAEVFTSAKKIDDEACYSGLSLYASEVGACTFCRKPKHMANDCFQLLKFPLMERKEALRSKGLCFVCLAYGHLARFCKGKCSMCGGHHHRVLCMRGEGGFRYSGKRDCDIKSDVKPNAEQGQEHKDSGKVPVQDVHENKTDLTATVDCNLGNRSCVVVPTARVRVFARDGSVQVATVLIDSGSQYSYISSRLVGKIRPRFIGSRKSSFAAFGGGRSDFLMRNIFEFRVEGYFVHQKSLLLKATEVPVICAPLSRPTFPVNQIESVKLDFADDYTSNGDLDIDILIGEDFKWSVLEDSIVRTDFGPVAQASIFGYVLSGLAGAVAHSQPNSGVQLLCLEDIPESLVRSLSDFETIGINDDAVNKVGDKLLEQFKSSVKYDDVEGRYEVSLPWKDDCPELLNNKYLAQKRLISLNRKLSKDPELRSKYDEALREMEVKEFCVEVGEGESEFKTFYLPHRPVIREASSSTKIRPVFDASAAGPNGISLNDCLESGPPLNPHIPDLLTRFRRWKIAVSADVSKAFLQIKLRKEDQDCQRFLWDIDGKLRAMKFQRVTFGVKSSPFLLSATILHHLSLCPPSRVVSELRDNMYVDDFLSGADSAEEAKALCEEADRIMKKAGMNLAKWATNDSSIFSSAPGLGAFVSGDFAKVLGAIWIPSEDVFAFSGVELPSQIVGTKRILLSFWARLWDPLGLIAPFSVTIKFLFQSAWKIGVKWDNPLPAELEQKFQKWLLGVKALKQLKIPRRLASVAWSEAQLSSRIDVFCDSSTLGYGAVVYLSFFGTSGGETVVVKSLSRVAPLKTVTLPKLELMACLLGAKLVTWARKTLRLPDVTPYYCWTDSMIALGWIRGDPSRWKLFVANRVRDICELTDPAQWGHVASASNPADLTTRGLSAEELIRSGMWWNGPDLLRNQDRPRPPELVCPTAELPEVAVQSEETLVDVVTVCESVPTIACAKFRSLNLAVRVVALVLKYFQILRSRISSKNNVDVPLVEDSTISSSISSEELKQAKLVYVKIVQHHHYAQEIAALQRGKALPSKSSITTLTPFIDDSGLLRCKGRLQSSELSYASKHPIILPSCWPSELIVRSVHFSQCHPGVDLMISEIRNSYWIVGMRRLAKRVKKSCLPCQRFDTLPCNEPMAPLPKVRVTQAPAFTVTGIDHAGPLYCVDFHSKKFYICLFVCGVTRAVHLELCDSLTTADFMLCLRRFAARKRVPDIIYSDNASTFGNAAKILRKVFGATSPIWRNIVPRAPWWGGWWERLVRTVKSSLRKCLGKKRLSKVELETTLFEVEALVNSRPLTAIGDDVDNYRPLTPNCFLLGPGGKGIGLESLIEDPQNVSRECLADREQARLATLEAFWKMWSQDYIRNLPPFSNKFKKRGNLKVGSIVLVKEDKVPRLKWPLGRVEQLHTSSDGICRSATLRTPNGKRTRPIQRLYDLEVASNGFEIDFNDSNLVENVDKPEVAVDKPEVAVDKPEVASPSSADNDTNDEISVRKDGRPRRAVKRPARLSDF